MFSTPSDIPHLRSQLTQPVEDDTDAPEGEVIVSHMETLPILGLNREHGAIDTGTGSVLRGNMKLPQALHAHDLRNTL